MIFNPAKGFLLLFFFPLRLLAQFEQTQDSVVQLYGVVMTADSLKGLPSVSVVVKGTGRGTITNEQGVFSIVVLKGNQIEFTSIGFKPKTIEGLYVLNCCFHVPLLSRGIGFFAILRE